MIRSLKNITAVSLLIVLAACGNKQKGSLAEKKAELEQLKKEQIATADKITALEADIAKLDTSASKDDVAKLVGTSAITTQKFIHYIDLQGRVDADNISYITPRLGGGQVKAIFVKKGDFVKKGQLLLQLDDAVIKQAVTAAKKSAETLKTQLSFAKDLYSRQSNLWKQGIGTEVQLLSAKNNVESLEKQVEASEANVRSAEEQLHATNVYSDVEGIADEVNVKVGELFAGMGQIKIVNTRSLKVVTDVPENYGGNVKMSAPVIVVLPDINKTYNTAISVLGKTINVNNRSFSVEAKLPYDGIVRPNQMAQIKIQDYLSDNAIAIPVNTMQTDDKGKYVFIAVKEGNKLVARKKQIIVGELYGQLIEVKSGLAAGDMLITEGYQNIYDGQRITTDIK
ncbi:MAG: efflux RND transporter periplasmic adaptor subunit [Bacteroidota bacterium]|nr:efflux RND transporter periplasmic adaptor subunit [Bacteroidota bacterium]